MRQESRRLLFRPTLLCLALLGAASSQAASLPIPNTGDALRSLEPRPSTILQQQPALPDALLPAQPLPEVDADNSASLAVTRFRVSGNNSLPQQAIDDLLRPWEGRELSFADLQQIALELTRLYRSAGYLLAQAYLPAQDVNNGEVLIQVLEGHVSHIRISPQGVLRQTPARLQALLRQGAPQGHALQQQDIERALLLVNDLPGIHAQAALEPGQTAGSADLELLVAAQPMLSGGVQVDNHGLDSTGQYRLGGDLRLLDPLGIGDQLNLRALTAERGDLVNGGIDYSLPLGNHGTRLRLGISYLEYELGERFRALDGHGRASVFELGLSHPLIRQRGHNLYLHGGVAHKRLTDVLDAVGSDSRKRIDLFSLGFDWQRLDSWNGVTSARATWSEGRLRLLDATERQFDGLPGGLGREGRFSKLEAGLARSQTLTNDWRALLGINGQRAFANLDSVEKFSLGGPFGPRAYPLGEASGDHGWLASSELQWQPRADLTLGAFIDYGWVRYDRTPSPLDQGEKDRHLRAYGLNASYGQAQGFYLNAALAWPGASASRSDPDQHQPRLYAALGYRF